MDNNQFVIRNAKITANTESLSVANGSISAGSIVVSDDYQSVSGKLLNKKGFVDGETVTVTGITGRAVTTISLSDDGTFTVNAPNSNTLFYDDVKAYQDYDFIVYNGEECIIYYPSMSEYIADMLYTHEPYILPDESDEGPITVQINATDLTKEAILPDGTTKPVYSARRAANYGATLRVTKESGDGLNVKLDEVYVAKITNTNGIACEAERDLGYVNVLGVEHAIVTGIKKTIVYEGEEVELVFDTDTTCHISTNEMVEMTCDEAKTVATMLVYEDVSGVTEAVSYTYPIKSYDGIAVEDQKYTIDENDTVYYNGEIIGYFTVAGISNQYECELVPYFTGWDGDMYSEYGIPEDPQIICRTVILNGGNVSFTKVGGLFGSPISDNESVVNLVGNVLEISHVYSGYTLPLFITNKVNDNMSQEALVHEKFTEYEINKAVADNPVVDMERDIYFPAYKANGVYNDYFDSGFSPVEEIQFNLHFRTRDMDTLNVIEDDKAPGSLGVCNWFVTDYYDAMKMVEPRCNGADSQFYTTNVDRGLYKASDLLGFVGFNDVDITGRAKKLSKSFIRLLFFDSPDMDAQTLLYSTTVFVDIDRLNGIHMRNIQSFDKFLDVEGGYGGMVKHVGDNDTYEDMRMAATVTYSNGKSLIVKYGDRDATLFSTGDKLFTRLIDKGTGQDANEIYTYKVVKDEDIDTINRTIRLESDTTVSKYAVGSRIYIYRSTYVTDTENRYLIKNECTTFSEPLTSSKEKEADGKWHEKVYPSFDENNRLSTRFTIHGNHSIDETSDGFYLYIFKEFAKKAHPTTIYMKVEYNHAGIGTTIPFMRLTDDNGKELTKISEITSEIKAGYPIKKALESMYIPISVVYDTKLDKYVWYYQNNNSQTLCFNLFEVKYQAIETKDIDCQLALSDYGTFVNGLSGSTSVSCSNVTPGKSLSTSITYDSHAGGWINTSVSGNTVTINYSAFPASYYSRRMADDDNLVIKREGYVRVKESSSCYTDYALSQGLSGYVFASRPYELNGTTKEYIGTLSATKYQIDASMKTYYIDILCDSDDWSVVLQSATRPGVIAIEDKPNKRVILKVPENVGGKNTVTYMFSTSGGDRLHEQQTITLEQQPKNDLFNTTPSAAGGVTYTYEAGTATYYIDTNAPITSRSQSDTWAQITWSEETATVSGYRYKMVVVYGSNAPVGTAEHSAARTEILSFVVDGVTKTIVLTQEGYTTPMMNMDYRHEAFYSDAAKQHRIMSKEHFDDADYTSKTFRLPNDEEYYVEISGITSYSTAAIEILDADGTDRFNASVNSVLNPDGYSYTTTVTLHCTTLPYSIEDRAAYGVWDALDSSMFENYLLLDTTKWHITNQGYYGAEFAKVSNGSIVEYKYVPMTLHSGMKYKVARQDGFTLVRFIRCQGQFNPEHPTINALEITPLEEIDATNNVYTVKRGFRENTYRIFNGNDPSSTLQDTFTVRQISDRYVVVNSPSNDNIVFDPNGGTKEVSLTVSPATCTIDGEVSFPRDPYFTAKDKNGVDIDAGQKIPNRSTGLFKFDVKVNANTTGSVNEYGMVTLNFNAPDGATRLYDYSWYVTQEQFSYNLSLDNDHPTATADLSRGGSVTHIKSNTSVIIPASLSNYIGYTWDNETNHITFNVIFDEAGVGYTGTTSITGDVNVIYYDKDGGYNNSIITINLLPTSNG